MAVVVKAGIAAMIVAAVTKVMAVRSVRMVVAVAVVAIRGGAIRATKAVQSWQ